MSGQKRGVNVPVLLGGLLFTAALVGMLASGFGHDPREVPKALEGKPAPVFKLPDLEGQVHDLADLRGKTVVVNFWSTWCLPCKQEHGLLVQAPQMYPDVVFLGVLYSDEPEKARAYLRAKGSGFPHLVDEKGRIAIDYGVAGVPETYFINPAGKIIYKQVGPLYPELLDGLIAQARNP